MPLRIVGEKINYHTFTENAQTDIQPHLKSVFNENLPKGQFPVSMYVKLGITLRVAFMMSAMERLTMK